LLIPVCYVPVAVGDQGNCADSWDPSLLIFYQVLSKTRG
jgi:hypothetical protein